MATHTLKEVSVPYTVNAEDEAIGRDIIVIRRNGEPIAVVVLFAEYQAMAARPLPGDLGLSRSAPRFSVCCLNCSRLIAANGSPSSMDSRWNSARTSAA